MGNTISTRTEQEEFLLYSQLSAAVYNKPSGQVTNTITESGWQMINFENDPNKQPLYYYEDPNSGFDAAIYYNLNNNEVFVVFRGTEFRGNDGDVAESARILNNKTNLTQFDALPLFKTQIDTQLSNLKSTNPLLNTNYMVVGHSLGGALAAAYMKKYGNYEEEGTPKCLGAIGINSIGVGYKFGNENNKVTNYLVMNDFFCMSTYDQEIGTIKLIFPIKMNDNVIFEQGFAIPHNETIYDKKTALFASEYILDIDASKWSKEKGVAIWFYDINNGVVDRKNKDISEVVKLFLGSKMDDNDMDGIINIIKSCATKENLKQAINTMINEIKEFPHTLHYTTETGDYIIGSDEITKNNIDGNDKLTGTDKSDIIWGNSGKDIICGGSSADILIGGEGDDTIYGGSGHDVLIAGNANDSNRNKLEISDLEKLFSRQGAINVNDFFSENGGKNTLRGGSGNDLLIGDKDADYLDGGNDNDYLYGGSGNDVLVGGKGQDYLYGGSDDDILIAGDMNIKKDNQKWEEITSLNQNKQDINTANFEQDKKTNKLYGDAGNDLLIGDKGNDYLDGGDDNDYLYGGKGNDTLIGGSGDDYLVGGQDSDRLEGGEGYDKYIIKNDDGADTIYDSDGIGHIKYNENILHGSIMKEPIGGVLWIDAYGNIYFWNGVDGSDLIINGTTTVESFKNGKTLEIYLGKYKEKETQDPEIQDIIENNFPNMDPTKPMQENPKNSDLAKKIHELYPNLYPKYLQARKSYGIPGDPIILDIDGNGIQIANDGAYFDYDGDGYAEATGWISGDDALLVNDKNNNGIIDDGSEVLVHDTLAEYDSNNDGIIDENDEQYNELKVLRSNGTLQSLLEAGVKFISLNTRGTNYIDEYGNTQFAQGTFTKTDGSVNEYGEFLLQTDTTNALEKEQIEVSDDVLELPEIKNWGKSSSLHQAIMKDETETLKELVESFITETNDENRMNLIDQILEKWANASDVENGSRGEFIDAKKLAIIETFMGIDFYSENEGEEIPQNPNQEAGQYLTTLYEQLKTYIYAELMSQTHLKDLVKNMEVVANEEGTLKFDLTNIVSILKEEMETNPTEARQKVYEFAKYIKGFGYDTKSNFFNPKDDDCFYTTFTKDDRELKWLIDTISKTPYIDERGENEGSSSDDSYRMESQDHFHALRGDDVAYGSNEDDSFAMCNGDDLVDAGDGNDIIDTHGGNDIVFAGAGDDVIHASDGDDIIFGDDGDDLIYPDHGDDFNYAEDGNDIIRGGKGNDTIHSMVGDDTFIFNRGDGQDVVFEHQGIDTFYFGKDITWDDLIFEQVDNDMVIKIKDTDDQITVKDWFLADEDGVYRYNNHKIEIFEFADGSKHYKDEITVGDNTESITYNMNEYEDHIDLASNYKTTVNLKQGWNDVVAGQNSDDTYVLNTEQTDVLIQDYDGNNTIKFGDGIQLAQTFFAYNEDGLEVWFEYFDAHMQIQGDIDSFKFEFADGTVLTDVSSLLKRDISYVDYIMNENQEELRLLGNDSLTVIDNNRESYIITNNGDTTIDFGQSHTQVESINGGNDVYIYNLGDCDKYINDFGGVDTIRFGEGISVENIHFLKDLQDNNLEIWFDLDYDNNDHLTIENFFGNDNNKIEYFEFADGSVIDDVEEYIRAWGSRHDEDLEIPENIQEAHLRGEGHSTATGNDNNNWLGGNFGDNSFVGGKGDDYHWDDCKTNERYYYNIGDGNDHIDDIGGIDTIIFGEGITKENIRFYKDEENGGLVINFDGYEGSIYIQDYFNDDERKIELFKFADGTVIDNITVSEITSEIENENGELQTETQIVVSEGDYNGSIVMDESQTDADIQGDGDAYVLGNKNDNHVTGNAGNNTYALGGGNDTVIDTQGGDDTYHYNLNNGHDVITDIGGVDTVKFGRDISPDNLRFEQVEHNLVISFRDENRDGSLTITDYFSDDNHKIENFVFDDGTIFNDITDMLTGIAVFENHEMEEASNIEVVRMAGDDNISVVGNSQDNVIVGNSGNNTFEGKEGDDYLIDHAGGNDTYIYNIGDGYDTIDDIGGIDTIKFGPDVTLENLAFEKTSTDLNIWFHNIENNGLCIRDFFSDESKKIERFELSDGTVITDISNYITAIGSEDDVTLPEGVSQIHLWGEGNTTATGNDLDNWIGGNDGDNTIIGGKGDDYLYDDRNTNETYIYNLGDGHDCINDWGGYDVIQFGEGITKDNLVFIMNNGDLLINFRDDEGNMLDGSIRIEGHFWDDNRKVEKIEFADGSTLTNLDRYITILASENDFQNYWSFAEVHLWGENDIKVTGSYSDEIFVGNDGNNTYDPQGGTDTINSGTGNDTIIYNHDYQNKFIIDRGGEDVIKFGSGIDLDNTKFVRSDNHLRIYFPNNGNGFIQIEDYFVDDERKIERFEFADGTVITEVTDELISGQASYGDIYLNENEDNAYLLGEGDAYVEGNDNENNFIYSNSGNNTFNGKGGHDHIESRNGGNDTYIYNIGDGHDYIIDIGGDDVVKFGEGISLQDVRFSHKRNDLQVFVDIGEEGGSIHIENYFKSDLRKIERFEFADGTVITDVTELISGIDIDSDYTFDEESQIREVYMTGKEDLSVIGNSKDTHVEGNEGNNTYDLKGGNDDVYDPDGDDTYIYNLGDGDDFYNDENGFDTLKLGEGITSDMIRMERQDNGNLRIWFYGHDYGVTICEHFWNDNKKLERIVLADGSEITDFTPFFNFVETEEDYTIEEGSHIRDVIAVGTNNVTLTGNNDDNHFEGNEGNTTFEGKGGNDSFHSDKGGNDTYIYNLGDGWDFITDIGGNDTIVLGEGITQDMIRMRRQWSGNLEIFFDGEEGNIVIQDYFNNDDNKIEKIILADNTEITDFEQFFHFETVDSDYTLPEDSNKNEIVINSSDDISVQGNSQDNHVEGNFGNNTYDLKGGNDDVYDPDGDDTYIYNLGDGFDFINDDNGFDTLRLGEGITQDMIRMEQRENGNLDIYFDGYEGGITICEHFWNDNKRLERIVLADGSEITDFAPFMPQIEVDSNYTLPEEGIKRDIIVQGGNDITINGNSQDNYIEINTQGNVTIQGNGGNDYVNEQAGGNTTYIYNQGDGWDTIRDCSGYDTVKFGAGLNASDMKVMNRDGNGIEIWFDGVEGNLVIEDCLENPDNRIERFEFADGTVITNIEDYMNCIASENNVELPEGYKEAHLWGEGDISATGNDEDNHFNGNSGNNTFEGKKGNDNFWDDQGGDDTFVYNLGDGYDNIANIGGYDTIQFGAGITENMLRFERCDNGDLEISIDADTEENCGSIRIQNYFNDDEWKIERVILADNTEITDLMSRAGIIEVDSDYAMTEDSNINYVMVKGENDVNITGNSQDNHIDGNEANNTYDLKGGNDFVYDPNGNDSYIYNLGDGNLSIHDENGYDKIKLGEGITEADLTFLVDDYNNIHINFIDKEGDIMIINQNGDVNNQIEEIELADGTIINDINSRITRIGSEFHDLVLSEGMTEAHLWGEQDLNATGNNLDNHMSGNTGNNTFNGKGGNDNIYDPDGNDTYIYNLGDGDDFYHDEGGYDTLQLGQGITKDMIKMEKRDDNALVISFEGNEGSITVWEHFAHEHKQLERIVLADGTEITDFSSFINCDDEPLPDTPIEEEPPVMPMNDDFDVNLLIQEINSYGVDNDVVMTDTQNQNNEDLLLAMVS